jgi:Na+-transporting methylmalonyl-CoA/oxaloacetate decarboxylase beta subunit
MFAYHFATKEMSDENRLSGILKETAVVLIGSVILSSIALSKRHTKQAAANLNQTSKPVLISAFGKSFVASVGSFVAAGAYFRFRAGDITVKILLRFCMY